MGKPEEDRLNEVARKVQVSTYAAYVEAGEIVDKPYEAHQMRLAGHDWKTIANRLGYASAHGAMTAHKVWLQEAAVSLSRQRRDEALNLSLGRIEKLLSKHWEPALAGDVPSANVVLKCISEANKLQGLYEAPEQASTQQYVVIAADNTTYASQLQEIVRTTEQAKKELKSPKVLPQGDEDDLD